MKDHIGYCACDICELSKGKEPINPRCKFTGEICRIKEQMGEIVCKTCKYNTKKAEVIQPPVIKHNKIDTTTAELKEFYNFDIEPIARVSKKQLKKKRAQERKENAQLLTTGNISVRPKLMDIKNRDVPHVKEPIVKKESLFDKIKKFFGRN
jgi:hypothetical protein